MRTTPRSTASLAASDSRSVPTDRRRRARLRDLCDEVLASFRMARQPDPFTEQDRAEGRALVSSIVHRTR
jgi:hypothetical protein